MLKTFMEIDKKTDTNRFTPKLKNRKTIVITFVSGYLNRRVPGAHSPNIKGHNSFLPSPHKKNF